MNPLDAEPRCPNCRCLINRYHKQLRCFRPRIPASWPEWSRRRAMLEEAQDGWCACCDRPIPLEDGKRAGKYTCGRIECRKAWALASNADCKDPRRLAA